MSGIDWSTWLLLAEDAKQAEPAAPTGLPFPVLMGILLLLGYFLLWRPEQKKRQDFRGMLDNLKEKDRVVTIGGIHGVVTNVQRDADIVTVRIDESTGTKVRLNTSAIARVVTEEDASGALGDRRIYLPFDHRSRKPKYDRSSVMENSFICQPGRRSIAARSWMSALLVAALVALAAPAFAQVQGPGGGPGRRVNPELIEQTGTTWQGVARVATVIALLVIPTIIGNLLAKKLRMPEHGWRFAVALGSLAAAAVVVWTGEIKLGPDLSGGITLIYELADSGGQGAVGEPAAKDGKQGADDATAANKKGTIAEADAEGNIERLIAALSQRVDPSGTKEVTIRKYGNREIEIIIPKANQEDLDFIERKIYTAGALEFRITASRRFPSMHSVIELAEHLPPNQDVVLSDGREVARWVGYDEPEFGDVEQARARGLVTRLKGKTPQALVMMDDGLDVTGDFLRSASPGNDENGRPEVEFTFNSEGAFRFGQLTQNHLPNASGEKYGLGILLDHRLLSAPTIESKITDRGRISGGSMTEDEVNFVVGILNAGSLPAALNKTPISRANISPTLGKIAVEKGELSLTVALAVVAVFMAIYYRFAGLVACLALASNMLLILGCMVLIKGAFTLPGLAGLVLTVGMSVDANVLIYERIREELQRGAALRQAIRNGYARAWVTIFDSNVANLLTAAVIYKVAPDSVKGFGVMLFIGILMSVYAAVFLTRLIFDVAERMHWLKKLTMMQLIHGTKIDFMGLRKVCVVGSLLLIAIGMVAVGMRGKSLLDIDFTGGSSVTFVLDGAHRMDYAEVEKALRGTPLSDATLVAMDETGTRYTVTTTNDDIAKVEEMLAETFTGKLKTYHLDVAGLTAIQANAGAARFGDVAVALPSSLPAPLGYLTLLQANAGAKAEDQPADAKPATPASAPDAPAATPKGDAPAPASSGAQPAGNPAPASGDATEAASDATPAASDAGPASTAAPAGGEPDPFAGGTSAKLKFSVDETEGASGGVNFVTLDEMLKEALAAAGHADAKYSLSNPEYTVGTERNFPEWDLKLAQSPEQAQGVLDRLKTKMETKPVFPLSNKIGGRVAKQMATSAVAAAVLCFIGIIIYIWFRFNGVMYGLAAVVALVHDSFISFGLVALSAYLVDYVPPLARALMIDKFQLSLPVVAALLTLIGYSLNDTIVVFDRIREVKGKSPRVTGEIVNTSINQTLSRTLLTSLTTLMSVTVLYILGGKGIHAFAFALWTGIIVGTYSSIYIAAPILLWMTDRAEAAAARAARSKAA